jgi:CTP:phosphocholine cytidylyltransferase-like protein
MDLSTVIIGFFMVALCALPFLLSGSNRKKNEQKIKNAIFELAKLNNTIILQSDFWFKTAIGINTNSNELFFYRKISDSETSLLLHLNDYQKSRIVKLNDSNNHIEILQLVLVPSTSNKLEIILEFYNAELNPQINTEVQLIEKWSKLINNAINSSVQIKKAV